VRYEIDEYSQIANDTDSANLNCVFSATERDGLIRIQADGLDGVFARGDDAKTVRCRVRQITSYRPRSQERFLNRRKLSVMRANVDGKKT
jgi:hypothetical protein